MAPGCRSIRNLTIVPGPRSGAFLFTELRDCSILNNLQSKAWVPSIMQKAFNDLRYSASTRVGLLAWALTMLALPVLGWVIGGDFLLRGISLAVLIQTTVVLVILVQGWGWRRAGFVFVTVVGLAYLAELLGVSFGIPFGKYHYTALLQPQIAGVPALIPLAWWMLLPPAWAVSGLITRRSGRSIPFLLVSALAFTAWDLFIDPQMVAWGFWRWEVPGQYFGVPWNNYLGWFLVSALITFIANPANLPSGALSLVYVLTWILQTTAQGVFWQQPGPALAGFMVTCVFISLAFWRGEKKDKSDN